MPFVSDAQRKHFYANKQDPAESEYQALAYERANNAIKSGDFGEHSFYATEAEAVSARDDHGTYLAERNIQRAMPATSQAEKVDWAAWRGDFGKK
jgi:hypothetical protein